MPTLREMLTALVHHAERQQGISVGEQCAREWEQLIRKSWPGERIYIAPCDSRKDPDRANAIREAAKRLPTGVVSERFGVTRSYVYKVTKK
mgnify:CR=1 FL=1